MSLSKKLRLHLFILMLAVMIAGGSGGVLVVTYYSLLELTGDKTSSLVYSALLSLLTFAVMIWVAKIITEWATKTGRV